jgi:hypothetical protein
MVVHAGAWTQEDEAPMPDEKATLNEPQLRWSQMERSVVYLLTDPERYPPIWNVADIGREIDNDDPDAVVDPLCWAGLVHRIAGTYVVATPAAYRMVGLVGRTV